MVTEVSNTKYRLSKKGGATEVILFAHGSWCTADGKMFVPKGMAVHFYSAHGTFGTKGIPIAEHMLGTTTDAPLPQSVLANLMQGKQTEAWDNDRMEQEILLAKGNANAQGLAQAMQICETVTGKGFGNRQKVYNYSLSHDGPDPNDTRAESLFRNHAQSPAAIDLLIMQRGATGHLASAVSFARSKGEKYTVFHFLPCRYIDAKDTQSMRTVTATFDMEEGEFIETTLL